MSKFNAKTDIKITPIECDIEGELMFEVHNRFTGETLGAISSSPDYDEYMFYSYDCPEGKSFHSGTLMVIANKLYELNRTSAP